MNLDDLLRGKDIDPARVLVFRHRPHEPELNKVLPWLITERPDLFTAYQSAHWHKLEKAMQSAGYLASFIRYESGRALFAGLYSIGGSKPLTVKQYWQIPANVELKALGMGGFTGIDGQRTLLWFNLRLLTKFYGDWKGKLIVGWPPPERSWWRWAHRNIFPVLAILEDSVLGKKMPPWNEIVLTWTELGILPTAWQDALKHWRGIYYIFDTSDQKGYVGSAHGSRNILGRWKHYAASGHGGNRLLRQRDLRRVGDKAA